MVGLAELVQGIVVETRTKTWLGSYFYSDRIYLDMERDIEGLPHTIINVQHPLNEMSRMTLIGISAGIIRMALSIIHSIGHLLAAIFTFDKGHLVHAAKGGCEFLRGLIEATPFVGRAFANYYGSHGYWWIIKIYNPASPDSLDRHMNHWRDFRENRPTGYVMA